MIDFCLEGNALVEVTSRLDGIPSMFTRLLPAGAECTQSTRSNTCVYRASAADKLNSRIKRLPEQEVVHARWGRMIGPGIENRMLFAPSPVQLLRPALQVGIQADKYMRDWFAAGFAGHVQVNYAPQRGPSAATRVSKEKRAEIAKEIRAQFMKGNTVVSYDGEAKLLSDSPANGETQDVREFQTREVARFYAVPAPIFGADVTRWGGSLEPLVRLFYRFGFSQHINRLLVPFGFRTLSSGHRFEIDPTELVRGDSEGALRIVQAIVGDGQRPAIGTLQEARRAAGLPAEYEGELLQSSVPSDGNGGTGDE